ncbi:MAG: family 20 glycosylhydrolase [Clostridia bacterium]|nr:family 20 glycosylhydrolase [Clostridia bacterium]
MIYTFKQEQPINMPINAKAQVTEEFLQNYTYGIISKIEYNQTQNCITIGKFEKITNYDGEYVVNITNSGVYIEGNDYSSLMRGYITFLEMIKYDRCGGLVYVNCCQVSHKPSIEFRCVHLCVFPETKMDFLKKCVRSCAVAKYSHIILEFWGMLQFDCMKELSWPFAYTKDEIKNVVSEANALGVEIIPMFNHLGHASASREANGKHVVLDQNIKYEDMFDSYGWVWNFNMEEVENLHRNIRKELIEVCGKGRYFHIGCDEAYAYGYDENKARNMAEYVNKISDELSAVGRRCIMWHDMLLPKDDFKGYFANSSKEVSEILLNKLNKNIVIADWQYTGHGEIWKTSQLLKKHNFDTVCCPWDSKQNIDEAIDTVKSEKLYGIIHTTWNTLYHGFRDMIYAGILSYGAEKENLDDILRFYCAATARKVMPSNGEYEKCGWSENMIGPGL